MKTFLGSVVACCLAAGVVSAQRPEFEVATVKVPPPVALGTPVGVNLGTYRNGTLTLTNVTLGECLQFAYSLVSQEQVAGPDWIKSRDSRFDVVAKAPADTDIEGARRMLRTLLAERLKLTARLEQRPFSFVALMPGKRGPKLTQAKEGVAAPGSGVPGRITGQAMPMAVVASLLSRFTDQLVVDRTGMSGRYQLSLEWAVDDRASDRPPLSVALDEQLGLRLESRREPLDVVVVERAEKTPIEN